jgi:nucleotide-binding universal stress UspA family protein
MQPHIKRILAPVQTDTASLWLARQAAELANAHNASLHLLHVADPRECPGHFFNWFSFSGAQAFHRLTMEKTHLINTWERSLERDFDIPVSSGVVWGRRSKCILEEAGANNIDLIAVSGHVPANNPHAAKTELSRVIEKSPCQVITLLSGSRDISDWKQVVIPVNDYIPEARIQALAGIAGQMPLKVHLVTSVQPESTAQDHEFYFITETIKRLKPAGNIQVQCGSIGTNGNSVVAFLRYARKVGADLLMTNRHADQLAKSAPIDTFYATGYA